MAPRLSVIVPIYNVEVYLPACLDSLAAQTFKDLEVIMVDDGSPDGSADIAKDYAERDPRFRLVQKENAGLGAARNTGCEHLSAESEFVAFVDSDDALPPDAYRMMIASLDESGSDFVTGNVRHIKSAKMWQSPIHRILADAAQQRTHVSRDRRLLQDRVAWNKVFRRSFWEGTGLTFPEGVLYEDTPVMVPAHVMAEAVDVIAEPIYYWRLREGESAPSITQRRAEPKAVQDRTSAVESVSRFLAGREGCEELKREYDRTVLTGDLRLFLNALPQGDEEYRQAFLMHVNRYLDQIDPGLVQALSAELRVKWLLVRKHAMGALLEMMDAERRGDRARVTGLLRKHLRFPQLDTRALGLPRSTLRVDADLKLRAPLQELSWKDGKLHLLGHAWIDRIDQSTRRSAWKVIQFREERSGRRVVIPVKNVYRPECTTYSGQKHCNYDWAGWQLTFDPAKLQRGGRWQEGVWHIGIAMASGGLLRKRAVGVYGPKAANHPPYHWLDDDFRLLPSIEKSALKLRVQRVRALVTAHRADGEDLVIEGELREELRAHETLQLAVNNRKSGEKHVYAATLVADRNASSRASFQVRVPMVDVALLPEQQEDYELEDADTGSEERARAARRLWSTELVATGQDGSVRRFSTVVADGVADRQVRLPASLGDRAHRNEIALLSGHNGYLKLSGRPAQAVLTGVTWNDGRFTLSGTTRASLTEPVLVVKARDRFDEKTVPLRLEADGSFEASFQPSTMAGMDGALPLPNGRWNFFLRSADSAADVPFVIDRLAVPGFPVEGRHRNRDYAVEARWYDFPQLNCLSDLSVMEIAGYRQNRLLEDVYRAGRHKPLRESVLYISFNGRQCSDSPLAIHEELVRRGADLEHLWLVRDSQVELPATVSRVRMWGTEWFEALARCRYIVTNAHLPHWLERREGQVIVQTWHGTMLKKIGLDIEAPAFDPNYHERLRAEARNWSMFVSANRFSTPILERAMGYDGPIIESGYPRNDYLYAPDRDAKAERIKTRLGLPSNKKVVLYAPTWRDDRSHRRGQFQFDFHIDLEDARKRLGDDHILLVRRHSNVVDSVPGAGDGFVHDVSAYPDIADLYLISDILVTDYSSVMFDFAHLRRPMLFFTYDLEHYRDTLRGFYFDFEREAPGPLLSTSKELVDAVRDIDRVSETYRESYERFHETYCELDDGHASARVVDRMLSMAEQADRP